MNNKTSPTKSNMPQFGGVAQSAQGMQNVVQRDQNAQNLPESAQNAPVAAPQALGLQSNSGPQSYGSMPTKSQETPQEALGAETPTTQTSQSGNFNPVLQPSSPVSNAYSRRWHLWLLAIIAVVLVSTIGVVAMLMIKGDELGKKTPSTNSPVEDILPSEISLAEGLRRVCEDPKMQNTTGLKVGSGVVGTHLTGETYTSVVGEPEYLWICDWGIAIELEPSSDLLVTSNGAFTSGDSLLLSAMTLDTEYYKSQGDTAPQFYLSPQEHGVGGLAEIKRISTEELERIAGELRQTEGEEAAEAYLAQATQDVEFDVGDYQYAVTALQSPNLDSQDRFAWENESRMRLLRILVDEKNWVTF